MHNRRRLRRILRSRLPPLRQGAFRAAMLLAGPAQKLFHAGRAAAGRPRASSCRPLFSVIACRAGRNWANAVIDGNAELRRGGSSIRADWLQYDQPTDLVKAPGHVRVNRSGNPSFSGPVAGDAGSTPSRAFSLQPDYLFLANSGHGAAHRVDFLDAQRSVILNATFTTCPRAGPSWMPDWILKASTITLDSEEDVGTATGAVLSFKGVPMLPVPTSAFR